MPASLSGLSRRGWWIALLTVFGAAAFQVLSAAHALRTAADADIRPSFVVWGAVPALFALAVLLIARKSRLPARFALGWMTGIAGLTVLAYLLGYWRGLEADTAFLFIFAPLFQAGAYLVGGGFGLLLAAVGRKETESAG